MIYIIKNWKRWGRIDGGLLLKVLL